MRAVSDHWRLPARAVSCCDGSFVQKDCQPLGPAVDTGCETKFIQTECAAVACVYINNNTS